MNIAGTLPLLSLAALAAYIAFGGPKLSPEVRRVIKEVVSDETTSVLRGQTGYARSGSIQLWYEDLTPEQPEAGTVLLLMGMGGDALMWPRAFIDVLLAARFRVVRFDQRGTGLSDWMDGWNRKNAYGLTDLADDALAILDHLEIEQTHALGLSLGGMVAQEMAIQHPRRVSSLVLISTSPDVTDASLPTITTGYLLRTVAQSLPILRYRIAGGEENLVKERIAKVMLVQPHPPLEDVRDLAQHVVYDLRCRRGIHASAVLQHRAAAAVSRPRSALLANLRVPTLVIHGERDPMIPIEHGRRLAELIPSAKSLFLPEVGHVVLYPPIPTFMDAIVDHLGRAPD
ncbi:MAG TPA: alpha/beta hydrolase [Fimbriimonadaceae bacterium]|nr:alpha/beta hydrolase [Fimbriimonadaceae bacterium]